MPDPMNIKVQGPGPYGFRLSGGDGQPLAVVKLRQKSKAYESGLREGDSLLGINGLSCEAMSHAEAVALLESSTDHLQLYIIRDAGGKEAVAAAFQTLSAVLRRPAPGEIKINAIPPGADTHNQQPIPTRHTVSLATKQPIGLSVTKMTSHVTSVSTEPQFLINATEREKERQEFLQRSRGQDAIDEFKDKEEVIVYRHKPNMPGQAFQQEVRPPAPTISVQKVKPPVADDDEESCVPTRGCTAVSLAILSEEEGGRDGLSLRFTGGGPSIVPRIKPFESSTNRRITNEDLASYIKFQISQFPGQPWLWHPSQVYKINSQPTMEDFKLDSISQDDLNRIREELIAKHLPHGRDGEDENGGESRRRRGGENTDDDDIPLHLLKILTTIEDIDPLYWKKKKIYADSTFYDDEDHTYPTIQEQIKMARGVAMSLTSASNVRARGQRMFIKRKEKSEYWDIDNPAYHRKMAPSTGEEPYYNPKPWKAPKKSSYNVTAVPWNNKLEEVNSAEPTITSPSTGKPEIVWGPKNKVKVPDVFKSTEFRPRIQEAQSKFELRSGKGRKVTHVGGKVSFGHSDELLNKRGKAGKLFAQRRAKSEERDEALPMFQEQSAKNPSGSQSSLTRPLRAVLNDIIKGGGDVASPPSDPGVNNNCRLKEMIAEYSLRNNYWGNGSAMRRTDELFSNGQGVTVSSTTVRETKFKKGENGPRLKPKSSGGYRPVNFKAPLLLDLRPSSAPQDLAPGFSPQGEPHLTAEAPAENGDTGITDF